MICECCITLKNQDFYKTIEGNIIGECCLEDYKKMTGRKPQKIKDNLGFNEA